MTDLVCPGCRTSTPERIDLRTIERSGHLMICECGRRYAIVDGIPVVMTGANETLLEPDLPVEVSALLAARGPDDAPYARLLEHLSIYLDAHWSEPASPGLGAKIAALAHVARAVELGCSVGGFVAQLAATSDHVVGIDLHCGALRRARKILDGERLVYNRRVIGRHYEPITIEPRAALANTQLVCADALDPPLVPGAFDRVVALNLLDSVAHPMRLLGVIDQLIAPRGELVITSPYAWQSSVMADEHRIGGADPAASVLEILTTGAGLASRYVVEDACDLDWTLRRDARSTANYRIHYVRARKL